MENNRKIIYLVISIVIIFIVVGIIMLFLSGKKYKNTIFIGNNAKYTIEGGKIVLSTKDEKARKQRVKVFYNNQIIDGYVKTEDEGSSEFKHNIHIYSKDKELLSNEQNTFAFSKGLSLTIIGINSKYVEELSDMIPIIRQTGIDITTVDPNYFMVYSFDIDEDKVNEHIYTMGLTYNNTEYYSRVIMEKDGNYYLIAEETSNSDEDDKVSLDLFGILDFNSDGYYEYVVSRDSGEFNEVEYNIYNFDGVAFSLAKIN